MWNKYFRDRVLRKRRLSKPRHASCIHFSTPLLGLPAPTGGFLEASGRLHMATIPWRCFVVCLLLSPLLSRSTWQLLLLQNECAAPWTISHFLLVSLVINSVTTQMLQVKRKLTYVFQCPINVAEWENSGCYALLYTDNAFFFFVHALCNRYHNNIPKQAHGGGANVQLWLEQDYASHGCFGKENQQMIHPRQQQHGTQMDADGKGWCEFSNGVVLPVCRWEGLGDPVRGLEHQKKGLANDNPELKGEEVKDFACFWPSRHISLPVPVDQERQVANL